MTSLANHEITTQISSNRSRSTTWPLERLQPLGTWGYK